MKPKEAMKGILYFVSSLSKKEKAAVALILLFMLLFFKPVISGDGFGYYAILEGIGRYHSLDLSNAARFNEISGIEYVVFNGQTGRYVSKFAPGTAIFSLPLYLVSLFLDDFPAFHIADDFFLRERGDILIRMASLPITSAVFFIFALLAALLVCRKLYPNGHAWLAVLAAFFATPIIRYATYDLSYSHAIEAGLFALLVFLFLFRQKPMLLGIVLGLLAITRYPAGIFALPLLAFCLWEKKWNDAGKLLLGFAPFVIALVLYFNLQFGSFTAAGYESGFESALPIHLFDVLFDLNRGIIFWTPLILLSIAGLFYMQSNKKYVLVSFFVLNLLVYSAWQSWHSGWSFGNRFFAMFFVLYAIGIAALIARKPRLKPLVIALMLYSFFLALLFFAQTEVVAAPYNFTDTINYWFVQGNLPSLPAKILEKVSIARLFTAILP